MFEIKPLCKFPHNPAEDLVTDDGFGYYNRGAARIAAGRRQEGIADLEKAKQQDAKFGLAYWLLGILYREEQPERALVEFQSAAELFADNETMAASAQLEASKLRERLALS
ncbi:MAG: hypothetical protein AAFW84_26635 [Cyanobacteria bacterium J06635_15]